MHNSTNAHQGGQCGFALPPLMDSPKTQRRALLALPLPVQRPPCGENTAQPNDTSNRQQHIRPTDIQIIAQHTIPPRSGGIVPYHVPIIHKVAAIGLRRTFLQFNHAHCPFSAVAVGVKAAAGGVAEINSLVVPHIFILMVMGEIGADHIPAGQPCIKFPIAII